MSNILEGLLKAVSDWNGKFTGAFNIRENGECAGRQSTKNIRIESKTDKPGLDIRIRPGTKGETVSIPACVTHGGVDDLVYNDFFVGEGADVTIVAGCGVHTDSEELARHNGIHRFFLEKGARVTYLEKHVGTGKGEGVRSIDPVTEMFLEEDAVMTMDTSQIGGVDRSVRKTSATLAAGAKLHIHERILTEGEQQAHTEFPGQRYQRRRAGHHRHDAYRPAAALRKHMQGFEQVGGWPGGHQMDGTDLSPVSVEQAGCVQRLRVRRIGDGREQLIHREKFLPPGGGTILRRSFARFGIQAEKADRAATFEIIERQRGGHLPGHIPVGQPVYRRRDLGIQDQETVLLGRYLVLAGIELSRADGLNPVDAFEGVTVPVKPRTGEGIPMIRGHGMILRIIRAGGKGGDLRLQLIQTRIDDQRLLGGG